MSWKAFILQSIIILFLFWITAPFFLLHYFNKLYCKQEEMTDEAGRINRWIDHMELVVDRIKDTPSPTDERRINFDLADQKKIPPDQPVMCRKMVSR